MAENSLAENVESTNEDFRKHKNYRMGGRRQRSRKEMSGDNQEEANFTRPYMDRYENQISQLTYNATLELPPLDLTERKFAGRNRIYISNIGTEITEADLEDLFKPYGETCEFFINKEKSFAFLKVDYHANAIRARKELDGAMLKSKVLRMKISPSSAIVKVKNLVLTITSELLYYAFSPFGEIENATVCVDERGRSIGEGIIDFTRKNSAMQAIQKCKEKCYFLSYALKPVIVEPYEIIDQTVGLLDKHFGKRHLDFSQDRSVGPRLAELGSFEHEYGARWKSLFDLYKQKEEALRVEFRLECEKLEAQMAYARYEHETESLREQLRVREMDKERQKREWEAKERQAEEEKIRAAAHIRQTQEEIQGRLMRQQEDMRRRQEEEANMLLQAQNLSSILDTQEHIDCDAPSSSTREMTMGSTYDSFNKGSQQSWSNNSSGMEGRWVREGGRDRGGFQTKRRRF